MCVWIWVRGSRKRHLPFDIIKLLVLSESSNILPRAWASIVFLALGVLVVGMWEGAASPIRFGIWASSRVRCGIPFPLVLWYLPRLCRH